MQLIDTHVHLWHEDYSPILSEVIFRAKSVGVARFVVPGINLKTSRSAISLAKQYPEIIPAVGLHPMENNEPLESFIALAERSEVKAIGEIGIDRRAGSFDLQEKRFRFFLELAVKLHKPAIIHILADWRPVLKIVGEYPELRQRAVWHCFNANLEASMQAKQIGMLLSFTAIIARKRMEETHEVIKTWPLENMMLETDGPWLSWPGDPPAGASGGPNEPITILKVAKKIAEIKQTAVSAVEGKTLETAKQFFKI